jgi:hypothetical protein
MTWFSTFADDYVAEFNEAVATGDFSGLLTRFTGDAVLRFENVPPAGSTLEFAGKSAYSAAYAEQPPDDQIDLTGEPWEENGDVVAGFAWRRDRAPGLLRLTVRYSRISRMVVTFGADAERSASLLLSALLSAQS